jgi:hypothetical protein
MGRSPPELWTDKLRTVAGWGFGYCDSRHKIPLCGKESRIAGLLEQMPALARACLQLGDSQISN